MGRVKTPREARIKRHLIIRKKIKGTALRPRLSIFRSSSHLYAQIIDDEQGHTLVAASTLEPELNAQGESRTKTAQGGVVGTALAQRALEKGITKVVFDRGGYKYHGRVKALAEAARTGGLIF